MGDKRRGPTTDNPAALSWFGALLRAFLRVLPGKADAALRRLKRRQRQSLAYGKRARAAQAVAGGESVAFDPRKGTFKHFTR